MARYSTTEELYKCPQCRIYFALREANRIEPPLYEYPIFECPRCEDAYITFVILEGKPFRMWGSKAERTEINFSQDFILRGPEPPAVEWVLEDG